MIEMTPRELKNSILQQAIQGKLVEQRSEEGSAEELYRQIQQEKQRLIAEGKIKKEKPLPEITEDEKPFDIPETWKWVRLGEIFNVIMGQSPSGTNVSENGNGLEFHQGKIYFGDDYLKVSPQKTNEITKIAEAGSILLCVRAPVGIVNIVQRRICIGRGLCALNSYNILDARFILYFVRSFENDFIKKSTGTTFKAITNEIVKNQLFPLPPLAEQKRIVARIEELLPLLDRYEQSWSRLETFNSRFPDDMKKSLLQYAIQGKLVEQRSEEGSAEELYRQIQQEKQRLIAEGKIKKEKPLPEITEDEKPFDIPETWKWVKLGEISTYAQQKQKIAAKNITDDLWSLDLEDIEKESGKIINTCRASKRKISGDKLLFRKGQVLYSKLRPYLKKILVAPDSGICSSEIVPFNLYGNINAQYVVYYLKSPYADFVVNSVTYGVKMPRVGTDTMIELLIPLPPLAEQKRIVAKLEQLLPLCERLK